MSRGTERRLYVSWSLVSLWYLFGDLRGHNYWYVLHVYSTKDRMCAVAMESNAVQHGWFYDRPCQTSTVGIPSSCYNDFFFSMRYLKQVSQSVGEATGERFHPWNHGHRYSFRLSIVLGHSVWVSRQKHYLLYYLPIDSQTCLRRVGSEQVFVAIS